MSEQNEPNIPDDLQLEEEILLPPNFTNDTPEVEPTPTVGDDSYVEPEVKSETIVLSETRTIGKKNPATANLPPLSLLYGTLENTVAAIEKQPQDGEFVDPKNADTWSGVVEDGYTACYRTVNDNTPFERPLLSAESVWSQAVEHNGVPLNPRSLRIPVESGERLTGADAVARVSAAVGLGAIIQFPCYHTGIWLSVKAPADVELYELERRIAMEKVALGRMTKGLVFSNTSVYIAGHLINFILSHVYSSTAPTDDLVSLKKILRVQDLPSIIWGMCCAIYPGGYPYRQPCVADVTKCTHVVEALLNITKLQWVDRTKLTDFQRTMLSMRLKRATNEELERYQSEFAHRTGAGLVKLNDQMVIELESPTIEAYETSGYSWVEACVKAADEQFGSTLTGKERSDYITDLARTTAPRQYSHWVKRIEITDSKGVSTTIEDRSSIEQSMARIASVASVKTAFLQAIGDYIDSTTVAIIGYLNYACPNCKHLQLQGNGERTRVIPIDMMQVFLVLQTHKIDQSLKDLNAI